VNEDGLIDYSEFLTLDSRYPLILFPAFRLQDTMQRNSLGDDHRKWRHVTFHMKLWYPNCAMCLYNA